mmetsp:Transcript_18284/g.37460  ORF Transcript_18284/g.37460 Transcript_18284/m.37460 type:complete len:149 (-) Transcript_18284:224-670(-)|eukprot:CAMPEP_0201204406 /NCGR_PEP_ID=MMETSP0851-20130426/168823_1 /ASSEMBLY_ACC=CAM_ASM_000631 /TAXON_ID=183588 /ORGANISM="Pseudo-nitzschia fraudulenta, Strain WWA7" /LENGTH=148 /DNA_ID=CAMNT_0047492513 /DNA_START=166 /DNA_END=612 /DNA_ORIENTATION=-
MDTTSYSTPKNRFKPFFTFRKWWKRRRFQYLIHVNTSEESRTNDFIDGTTTGTGFGAEAAKAVILPPTLCVETKFSSKISGPFVRTPTMNSLQDSIESMDSITESRCTLCDDEISEPLELGSEFLMEHLNFLSQSTQPQEVELVYNPH